MVMGAIAVTTVIIPTEGTAVTTVIRRTEAIASIGSAALDNEECSLLIKALRSMGLLYVEQQARI
jgi:formate dehydrogenase major subunit